MRSRGLSNRRCWACIDPTRARSPLGAATSPLPTSELAFPYVAAPGSAGVVVRLPRWAAGAPAMPPWGALHPRGRAIRMGAGLPPMDWMPFVMDQPWSPGHLEGEHGGQTPTLDNGPAWWHLYPPTEAVAGPFEPPTRPLRLTAGYAWGPAPKVLAAPAAAARSPWTWAGANYAWGAAPKVLVAKGFTGRRLGDVPPPLPPEEQGVGVVGVPGATPQIDSAGNVVGWYRVNPDGTTTMYDAQGNLVEATAMVSPPPPSSGGGPVVAPRAVSTLPVSATTLLYIGGAGAGLFLLMALLQKR